MKEQTPQITLVYDILAYQLGRFPQKRAVNSFKDDQWKSLSTGELIKRVNNFSCWLISQNLNKGDMVAIMPLQGNPEWLIIDFACQQLGVIVVPVHPTSTRDELDLILKETKPAMLIVADQNLLLEAQEKTQGSVKIYSLADNQNQHYLSGLDHIADQEEINELMVRKEQVKPDDIFTIMYTSGTSGEPKGVVLTHHNMVSNILFTLAAFPLEASLKVMSFLPFSHIFERSSCYAYLACGTNIYFVENRDTFLRDFKSAKPYFTTAVPRVLEKMYDYLYQQAHSQNLLKKTITTWAFKVAEKYYKSKKPGIRLSIKLFIARIMVLRLWTKQLGGKLECIVVGAASLRPEIARMFSAGKVRIREGYGMTETSPLISLNRFDPGLNRFGTVGIPIPAVNLKIDNPDENGEGEIWVKGPNVTSGYYKRPELNKEVFENGWFKTGDIGKIIDKRFLQITDRKKDIFKTSTGKYVAPQPLENQLKTSPFIEQAMVIGFNKPFIVALIVPNFKNLEDWCYEQGIHWTSAQYMTHNIKVVEKIEKEIEEINLIHARYQQVKKIHLCYEEWTVDNEALTGTHKLNRNKIMQGYQKDINKLYE
ncbi:MAG: long-chain fatty acid--CoA ligase [Bacteroidota bacterium]